MISIAVQVKSVPERKVKVKNAMQFGFLFFFKIVNCEHDVMRMNLANY